MRSLFPKNRIYSIPTFCLKIKYYPAFSVIFECFNYISTYFWEILWDIQALDSYLWNLILTVMYISVLITNRACLSPLSLLHHRLSLVSLNYWYYHQHRTFLADKKSLCKTQSPEEEKEKITTLFYEAVRLSQKVSFCISFVANSNWNSQESWTKNQ